MENYSPIYTFKGAVRADSAPSHNSDLVRKQDVATLSYIKSIDAASSSYLSVDGAGALKVNQLLVTDVIVDTTSANLAAYIGTLGNPTGLNKGDIIILTQPASNLMYIVKAGTGTVAGDYEEIQSSLSQAEILAHISGGTGINISAGGVISFNGNTGNVPEGANLYWTQGRFNTAFSAKSTADLTENASNKYFTDARARASLSGGGDITYNAGTGQISVTTYKQSNFNTDFNGKSTTDLSEGTNLYHTPARVRGSVSGTGGVSYNAGTGQFSLNVAHIRKEFSSQALTANTAKTLNHQLGERFVHVSVYDSAGNKIQCDIVCVDANNCTVKSVSNLSNVEIIVSL